MRGIIHSVTKYSIKFLKNSLENFKFLKNSIKTTIYMKTMRKHSN